MRFIKHPTLRADTGDLFYSPAVRMRRAFYVKDAGGRAELCVCGLGYGVYYINGVRVTEDRFIAPVSDYEKTLWYNRYDVSALLREGENLLCAHLGNGFFNENFESAWGHDRAPWRDAPKLALRLAFAGGCVESDEAFRVSADGALYYNQLRSGEYYDARREEDWLSAAYDDSGWEHAAFDARPPAGAFRPCVCPPVREAEEFPCVCVRETEEGRLYDFGSNFSGYVRLKTSAPAGTELILEHAEEIDGALRLKRNGLGIYYPSVPCQTDKVICAGGELVWSPKFTYHGFRYVLLRCVQGKPPAAQLCGVFVHQAAEQTGRFSCDVPLLDRIFAAGIRSSLSNMFYSLTDCPTREKLGWTNDAAASAEQLLLHFDCASLFRKIAQDLADAQREDGCMPGIVPTDGWGYDIGPVTDAFLYELPYRLYLYAADTETARFLYPYCLRNLRYLGGRLERGEWFDLGDWTGACNKGDNAPFVQCMLLLFFLKKMLVLADALGEEKAELLRMQARFEQKVREEYLCGGDYTGGGQTAPAMLLVYGMGEREKLRARLLDAVRAADTHLDCGMIGTQYIYDALSLLGEQDLVLRMVCAEGAPSFAHWFSEGATALWETFEGGKTESKNHHMFSNILAWFTKCIAGIRVLRPYEAEIAPLPFAAVKRAEGEVRLLGKTLRVRVERRGKTLRVAAEVPEGIAVYANGKKLPAGTNVFCVPPADGDKDGKKTEQEE